MNVGQAVLSTSKLERQLSVINPQAVQQGCVQIVDVDRVVCDVVGKIVGCSEGNARPDAAPGQPHREAAAVMIAAVVVPFELSLTVDRAAEFTAPDNQRLFKQPPLFEVSN